jgi:hypothetical protein
LPPTASIASVTLSAIFIAPDRFETLAAGVLVLAMIPGAIAFYLAVRH